METKYVRVPFEVNLAKEISNGTKEGKVVTRDDGNARIICWDAEGDQPIIALIKYYDREVPYSFCMNGLLEDGDCLNGDLMLEIPEYMTFKDGDVLYVGTENNNNFIFINRKNGASKTYKYVSLMNGVKLSFEHTECCYCEHIKILRFATESEKQELIDALKASKEPEAKDCLKMLGIEVKPECEFKPFDKVLVRDDDGVWFAGIFSHLRKDGEFLCVGAGLWEQCIPYNEHTAHLLGTTDNWEKKDANR